MLRNRSILQQQQLQSHLCRTTRRATSTASASIANDSVAAAADDDDDDGRTTTGTTGSICYKTRTTTTTTTATTTAATATVSSNNCKKQLQSYQRKIQQYGFPKLTIASINRFLQRRHVVVDHTKNPSFSCVELGQYCYHMAMAGEIIWDLHAYTSIVPLSIILENATQSDERRRKRRQRQQRQQQYKDDSFYLSLYPLLDGIPISIKSNIAVAVAVAGGDAPPGIVTNAGSRILLSSPSSSSLSSSSSSPVSSIGYNADITDLLLRHQRVSPQHQQQHDHDDHHHSDYHNNNNMVDTASSSNMNLIGTTTMDEFGMGSLGTNYNYASPTSSSSFSSKSESWTTTTTTTSTPRNPIPYIYSGSTTTTTTIMTEPQPWDDASIVQFITLPSDAIYEIHELLLQDYHHNNNINGNSNRNRTSTSSMSSTSDEYNYNNNDDDSSNKNYYYSPGGSSCGSAISIQHGSVPISIGTDTGGSIRLPSTYCNVSIGYKPAYGSISRYGVIPYANSFDTIGILGNSTSCIATMYSNILHRSSYVTPSLSEETIQQQKMFNDTTKSTSRNDLVVDELKEQEKDQYQPPLRRDSTQTIYSDEYISSICRTATNPLLRVSTTSTSTNNDMEIEVPSLPSLSLSSPSKEKLLLDGLKIGIPEAFSIQECSPIVRQVWGDCAMFLQTDGGATIDIVPTTILSSELIQQSLAAYYILVCAEASSNLSRYDGVRYGPKVEIEDLTTTLASKNPNHNSESLSAALNTFEQQYARTRTDLFGPEVIRRILCGTYVLSSSNYDTYYEQATKIRAYITHQFTQTFTQYDLLLLPTALYPPPKIPVQQAKSATQSAVSGSTIVAKSQLVDPTKMLANDVMTVPISLTGNPAISVSIPTSRWNNSNSFHQNHQEPPFQIGMQLVGPRLSDSNLFLAASVLENMHLTPLRRR